MIPSLRAVLLLELMKKPGHGYDLWNRLGRVRSPRRIYSELREMQDLGLVASAMEQREVGPAAYIYWLTEKGVDALLGAIDEAAAMKAELTRFTRRAWRALGKT